jgi:hypothetical protein
VGGSVRFLTGAVRACVVGVGWVLERCEAEEFAGDLEAEAHALGGGAGLVGGVELVGVVEVVVVFFDVFVAVRRFAVRAWCGLC